MEPCSQDDSTAFMNLSIVSEQIHFAGESLTLPAVSAEGSESHEWKSLSMINEDLRYLENS